MRDLISWRKLIGALCMIYLNGAASITNNMLRFTSTLISLIGTTGHTISFTSSFWNFLTNKTSFAKLCQTLVSRLRALLEIQHNTQNCRAFKCSTSTWVSNLPLFEAEEIISKNKLLCAHRSTIILSNFFCQSKTSIAQTISQHEK